MNRNILKNTHCARLFSCDLRAIGLASLMFILAGCSTIPVMVNMPANHPGLDLSGTNTKLPFDIVLVLTDSFTSFTAKSQIDHVNLTEAALLLPQRSGNQ